MIHLCTVMKNIEYIKYMYIVVSTAATNSTFDEFVSDCTPDQDLLKCSLLQVKIHHRIRQKL